MSRMTKTRIQSRLDVLNDKVNPTYEHYDREKGENKVIPMEFTLKNSASGYGLCARPKNFDDGTWVTEISRQGLNAQEIYSAINTLVQTVRSFESLNLKEVES